MSGLLATYEERGGPLGARHGGVFLIDLAARSVCQMLEWAESAGDLRERHKSLGLRGIALEGEQIYIAASDSLLCFSREFRQVAAWKNPYLRYCQAIQVYKRSLFMASSGYDSILGFDLEHQRFTWGLHVEMQGQGFRGQVFDPAGDQGPLLLGRLKINQVHANADGMYIGGGATGGMLHFNGRAIRMAAELPDGSRDAQPFRDGVLYNSLQTGHLRYSGRGEGREDRALAVDDGSVQGLRKASGALRIGFARGLCRLSDTVVAVGSCPASVILFDLAANEKLLQVTLSDNRESAVHSLAAWPNQSAPRRGLCHS